MIGGWRHDEANRNGDEQQRAQVNGAVEGVQVEKRAREHRDELKTEECLNAWKHHSSLIVDGSGLILERLGLGSTLVGAISVIFAAFFGTVGAAAQQARSRKNFSGDALGSFVVTHETLLPSDGVPE